MPPRMVRPTHSSTNPDVAQQEPQTEAAEQEKPVEEKVEQEPETPNKENEDAGEDNAGEEEGKKKVKVLKTASNKGYSAPRQDHCFIYVIKKLRNIA